MIILDNFKMNIITNKQVSRKKLIKKVINIICTLYMLCFIWWLTVKTPDIGELNVVEIMLIIYPSVAALCGLIYTSKK